MQKELFIIISDDDQVYYYSVENVDEAIYQFYLEDDDDNDGIIREVFMKLDFDQKIKLYNKIACGYNIKYVIKANHALFGC